MRRRSGVACWVPIVAQLYSPAFSGNFVVTQAGSRECAPMIQYSYKLIGIHLWQTLASPLYRPHFRHRCGLPDPSSSRDIQYIARL